MPPSAPSCFVLGEGSLIVQCALTLRDRGVDILGIMTREGAVRKWADAEGVPVVEPGETGREALRREPFDYLFSIVNLEMLPDEIVMLPRKLAINFHDGPLPEFAGINTPSWALIERTTEYGVTWHEMTAGADRGRILQQERFDLAPDETAFSLNARCFDAGMRSFATLVDTLLAGRVEMREQDFSRRTYFGKYQRPHAASLVDFTQDADRIASFVAAHDYGHGFPNPFGLPKILLGERVLYVGRVEPSAEATTDPPGTIVSVDARGLLVAAEDRNVNLSGLTCPHGIEPDAALLSEWGFRAGSRLERGPREQLTRFSAGAARREPEHLAAMRDAVPVSLAAAETEVDEEAPSRIQTVDVSIAAVDPDAPAAHAAAAFLAFLGRVTGQSRISVGLESARLDEAADGIRPFVFTRAPLTAELRRSDAVPAALGVLKGLVDETVAGGPLLRDLFLRHPELRATPRDERGPVLPVLLRLDGKGAEPFVSGVVLEVALSDDGAAMTWRFDSAAVSRDEIAVLRHRFMIFLAGLDEADTLGEVSLIDEMDRRLLLDEWQGLALDFLANVTIPELFSSQAAATPEAPALTFRGRTLSYAEVDVRSNQIARCLVDRGIGPGALVGVFLERSAEIVIAALAVMKAGGAYVPLDPAYPADRIAFMIEDSNATVIITGEPVRNRLSGSIAQLLSLDGDAAEIEARETSAPEVEVASTNLAYVIYTSGSTGRPKGVMVEHRNVVSFFTGMGDRLEFAPGEDPPGTWLAVTSLNFDISVLELFWTLTRGFEVVIHAEEPTAALEFAGRPIDFGIFYFSSDEGEGLDDKYQLLIEGAKFADRNGFNAVWTPERHFHAFGGLFPNPAVTSAALATITENVDLRAGSCVSPLHSPIRIAEDWAVVDNLSKGRVGISFAAGWQPNDFVIRPDAYADRRERMFRDIDTVRALWRGESISFPNGEGKETKTRILPKPYSKELEVWVTAAGNPETFRQAGAVGANLLTHLLGQTIQELAEKITIYRKAREDAGHAGRGTVSLMLHTYVGESDEAAKEIVREPMKAYLKSAVGLVKSAAWSFPTFKKTTTMEDGSFGIDHLSEEDLDALLNHAFERYYETAGLFGSVESCVRFVDGIKGADVDEIPCLIDFGIPTPEVLEALPRLAEVLSLANRIEPLEDFSIPALIVRHGITHFQCTPSQATLLLADQKARRSLSGLRKMMVGGEALPAPMSRELEALVGGEVLNMYGPTETTIWSSTHPVREERDTVPIGRPIPNTRIAILDANGELLPPGAQGELYIGGPGVARGYLNRPELTAERFIPDPFADPARPQDEYSPRLYRTGDLARFRSDGVLEFGGRLDSQVKLRGYRIELGEIEARLDEHPDVRASVAIVREDVPGAQRIVAYLQGKEEGPDPEALRAHLARSLPDYMVPSAFVTLDRFPETPNRKLDRNALPAPEASQRRRAATAAFVEPSSEVEHTIAAVWCEVLGVSSVGTRDNFFDLGGHSLLTIQVQGRLQAEFDRPISLVDLFRYTTVSALAQYLGGAGGKGEMEDAASRGADRRQAIARRQAARVKRR